jgi:hypothetical protein
MTKFIVYGGKRLLVALTTCDTKEAADFYKERGDLWYGADHPLTPLTVAELDSIGEIVGGESFVAMLSLRGGIQTIYHSIHAERADAEAAAARIETIAFAGKVEAVRHNLRPFPLMPTDGNIASIFEDIDK